ncbi:hypothetical protein [Arhodomonas sp. AD133]|uniref:hypothetical protein n=1 Tax=Arhodomonas sp. AD133 TaxID=3415009 RepID=UPI003EB83A4D
MTATRNRSVRWLLVLVAVLAAIVAVEAVVLERWRESVKSVAREAPQPDTAQADDVWAPADELVAVGQVKDMVARPLFLPTRRPPKPPEKPQPKEPAPKAGKLNLRLSSIVVTPEEQFALARVKGKGEKGDRRLSPGDEYNGWQVMAVFPDSVMFRSDAGTQELMLRPSGPPKNHAPPVGIDLPQPPEGENAAGDSDEASNSKG